MSVDRYVGTVTNNKTDAHYIKPQHTFLSFVGFVSNSLGPAGHSYRKCKPFNSGCYGNGISAMPLPVPVLSNV